MLLQFFGVLFENIPQLRIKVLRQPLLQKCADFFTILAVPVADWEKVAIFEAAEVRHSYPNVLVYLLWIWRRQSSLCSEGEFGDSICIHLFWICRIEWEWLDLWRIWCFCYSWLWLSLLENGLACILLQLWLIALFSWIWSNLLIFNWGSRIYLILGSTVGFWPFSLTCLSTVTFYWFFSKFGMIGLLRHFSRASSLTTMFFLYLTIASFMRFYLNVTWIDEAWLNARHANICDVHIYVYGILRPRRSRWWASMAHGLLRQQLSRLLGIIHL